MLQPIAELDRLVSFSPQPHAVAVDGDTMYVSSRATRAIDVIDRVQWKKIDELAPPGMPWGMTFAGGELVMTCGETDDDLRRIRRYAPSRGFIDGYLDCPDDTGSHLASFGGHILLVQWYNKAILSLDEDGRVLRRYESPHGVAGAAAISDQLYLLTTDDEDGGEYWITRLDLDTDVAEDVAIVPFHARGLAWDGRRFWTNHREADRTVAFRLPL
ncbi:MAG TPA: hypothetical protein VFN49_03540 [Candidatus Aquilonibacter sp.]|nr:hypothetical protein [Candidatus Aquilonibacter sp.]